MQPGTVVRCRNRDWVLLPSDHLDIVLLRSLAGASDQVAAMYHWPIWLMTTITGQMRHHRFRSPW
ncbi:hypothetical protein [Chloroflexus sp.]|uniref:hypothetical protein n=1 Tax=Chloroflexus sp. TaxID=1904827 RepID=UPI002ADE0F61|nr:hypothetical protein [Chloroflexus sp.]